MFPKVVNYLFFRLEKPVFLPRQHVETLKEAKMRDGNFCLQTRLQGKICGFHLIRAESTYMLDGGYFCFCFYQKNFRKLNCFKKNVFFILCFANYFVTLLPT